MKRLYLEICTKRYMACINFWCFMCMQGSIVFIRTKLINKLTTHILKKFWNFVLGVPALEQVQQRLRMIIESDRVRFILKSRSKPKLEIYLKMNTWHDLMDFEFNSDIFEIRNLFYWISEIRNLNPKSENIYNYKFTSTRNPWTQNSKNIYNNKFTSIGNRTRDALRKMNFNVPTSTIKPRY